MSEQLQKYSIQEIENRIFTIRGTHAMIDHDIAEMYDVETKVLNQAVKRNLERFLEKFEELTQVEDEQKQQPENINIKIGTVHSVKGQTHCATMYVETSYFEYETEKKRVKEALKKEEHNFNINDNNDKRGKQAFKMMYVGFSRPTHLLCFAALKDNFVDEIDFFKNGGWNIVDLTD
jgi:DNA helicase II / ATP-dependent DNA helicase PcrA